MERTLAIAATLILTLVACSPTGVESATGSSAAGNGSAEAEDAATTTAGSRVDMTRSPQLIQASLRPADDCDVLLDYFIEQALDQVGPWGLSGPRFDFIASEGEAAAEDSAGRSGAETAGQPSSTNVQVEGVDEGDIVKAVGDLLYVVSETRLIVMSTADGGVERLATLDLGQEGWGTQMLVHGDRLVLMGAGSSTGSGVVEPTRESFSPIFSSFASVLFVDVSDPSDPTIERRLTVDGSVITSRLVEGHLRVVIQAEPVGLAWSFPEGAGLRAERAATERNTEIVRESTIENWLPYLIDDRGDGQPLLDCGDVYLPPEPSGLGTLSILDFDLEAGFDAWGAASVVAAGSTVYANLDNTFIATSQWMDPALVSDREAFSGHVTRIHKFATPVDGELSYVASGDVDGFLLNQFAMDEFDGRLRVASTSAPWWWGGGGDSESRVSVLATEGDQMAVEGMVEGLGVTETIQAVRFIGPVGYVVTFRQTDPLYVIDLSDAANPVAVGELKIPGFSAYLHPVGEGRLLGVGQDADEETGQTQGLQLSLFDVSDPSDPTRLDTFALDADENATESFLSSPVQGDHKAFTAVDGAGYVPYEGYSWTEAGGESIRTGVIEVVWDDDTLDASRALALFDGKAGGDEWSFSPQRTVIKDNMAYVVGPQGLSVIDLDGGEVIDQQRF